MTRLRELRKKRGYTQIKMQMLTGIDQSDYSKLERGERYYTVEQLKRIATAYLKLLFPNVRTASDVNPKEFMKYCLRPAIKMRKIIWRQLSILDAEYKNDDKLMPEFTLKEISNEA